MLLFSRVVTPSASPTKVMPWAADITQYVNANSGLQVSLWSGTFGYPIGTLIWSSFVESLAALTTETSALVGQSGYLERLDAAADMVTIPGQDFLRQVVYGSPSDPPPIGAVGTVTTATALVDRMVDAVGWSVEIAQYLEGVMGNSVGVLTDVYGQMGRITWISVVADAAAADAAQAKVGADPGYLGRLPATKDLFIPGSGHVGQVTRLL
jgi:hypothetical protein